MIIKNEIQLEVKYIDETMGFGVFAFQDIDEGIIVETCYSIKTYNQVFNPCFDYLFSLSNTESLLPLGYGSIYNHSYTPNIHWRIVNMEKSVIEFYLEKTHKSINRLVKFFKFNVWNTSIC
jgi:hypothetical protein